MRTIATLYIFLCFSCLTLSGSVEKISKTIMKGDFNYALSALRAAETEAKERYMNIKDTMRAEKQKSKADEYACLLLLKGFVELKLNLAEAVDSLKSLTVFYDPYSTKQYLFKAHAWKLLATVNEARGDLGQAEFCRKKSVEEYESFKALGEQSDTQNIIDGILGDLS